MKQSMATGTRTSRHNTRLTLKATAAALAGAGLLSSASVWAQQAPAVVCASVGPQAGSRSIHARFRTSGKLSPGPY